MQRTIASREKGEKKRHGEGDKRIHFRCCCRRNAVEKRLFSFFPIVVVVEHLSSPSSLLLLQLRHPRVVGILTATISGSQ